MKKHLNWPPMRQVMNYRKLADGTYQEILKCGHDGLKTKERNAMTEYRRCWQCHLTGEK